MDFGDLSSGMAVGPAARTHCSLALVQTARATDYSAQYNRLRSNRLAIERLADQEDSNWFAAFKQLRKKRRC